MVVGRGPGAVERWWWWWGAAGACGAVVVGEGACWGRLAAAGGGGSWRPIRETARELCKRTCGRASAESGKARRSLREGPGKSCATPRQGLPWLSEAGIGGPCLAGLPVFARPSSRRSRPPFAGGFGVEAPPKRLGADCRHAGRRMGRVGPIRGSRVGCCAGSGRAGHERPRHEGPALLAYVQAGSFRPGHARSGGLSQLENGRAANPTTVSGLRAGAVAVANGMVSDLCHIFARCASHKNKNLCASQQRVRESRVIPARANRRDSRTRIGFLARTYSNNGRQHQIPRAHAPALHCIKRWLVAGSAAREHAHAQVNGALTVASQVHDR